MSKWSFPLVQNDPPLPGSGGGWVAVEKRRRLHRYRVAGDRQVEAVSGESEPAQGCELELARIETAGQKWWSICFEAFGDEASLEAYLRLTAEHIFEVSTPPMLEKRLSYGYPHWLRTVENGV